MIIQMMWLYTFLFLCGLIPMVTAANNEPDLPGKLLNELLEHLRDMKSFFCPYCIDYCLTGEQPPLPPGSGPLARQPPRLPFEHWDPFSMHQFPVPANLKTCMATCDIRLGFYLTGQGHRWITAMRDMAQTVQWDSLESWFERHIGSIVLGFLLEEGGCRKDHGGGGGGRPDDPPGAEKHRRGDLTDQWYDFLRKRRQEQDAATPGKETVPGEEKTPAPAGKMWSRSYRASFHDGLCKRVWSKVPWLGRWVASGCDMLTEPNLGRTDGRAPSPGRFTLFQSPGAAAAQPGPAPGVVPGLVPVP